METNGNSVAV